MKEANDKVLKLAFEQMIVNECLGLLEKGQGIIRWGMDSQLLDKNYKYDSFSYRSEWLYWASCC